MRVPTTLRRRLSRRSRSWYGRWRGPRPQDVAPIIGIAPNGSLAALDRHYARRKIERLGETVRIASMGLLADVAIALDPDPLASRMAPLKVMAEAVEVASGRGMAGAT